MMGVAQWGATWVFGDPDPAGSRRPAAGLVDARPDRHLLTRGRAAGAPPPVQPTSPRRFWILVERGEPSVCMADPGFPLTLTIATDVATLYSVSAGRLPLRNAVRAGRLTLEGRVRGDPPCGGDPAAQPDGPRRQRGRGRQGRSARERAGRRRARVGLRCVQAARRGRRLIPSLAVAPEIRDSTPPQGRGARPRGPASDFDVDPASRRSPAARGLWPRSRCASSNGAEGRRAPQHDGGLGPTPAPPCPPGRAGSTSA